MSAPQRNDGMTAVPPAGRAATPRPVPRVPCRAATRAAQAGFTLLEILVAVVVLGFLLAGLAQATRFGLRAWTTQARMIDRRADLDAADRTLRTLLGGLDPGYRVDPPNIVGTAHGLAFTASLPEGAALAAGVTERRMDVLLTVDSRHRLLLRWTPALHARRLAPPPPHETVLLEGVARIDLAYWRDEGGGGWADVWDGRVPPVLIRVGFVFVPGRGAGPGAWPPVVVAPRRAPADD